MPVTDFECQIARGQIGRYLGGGLLSEQAMSGLEEHLAECPGCKSLVAERRAELMGKLGGEVPTHAVVSMPLREENPLLAALRARAEKPAPVEEATPKPAAAPRYAKPSRTKAVDVKGKPVMGKPLALGALLAIVLIGMSYVSRLNGGKGALGGRASETFAAQTLAPSVPVIKEEPKPAAVTPIAETTPDSRETPAPVEPVVAKPPTPKPVAEKPVVEKPSVEKPKPVVEKPAPPKLAPRRTARKPVARKRTATRRSTRSASSVRVYGLDGRPLKP